MDCIRIFRNLYELGWVGLGPQVDGFSPPNLDQEVRVDDLPGRHRLRSSSSHRLHVPAYRLLTVGRRSFPVAASILWTSMPPVIQSSSFLTNFCHRLKTYTYSSNHSQTFCCNCPQSTYLVFLVPPSGTTCLSTSHLRRHSRFSDNDSRPFCFPFLPRHYHMTRVLLSPFITTVWTPVVLAIINI